MFTLYRNTLKYCEEHKVFISNKQLQKLGVPLPPKRPLSPYIKFSQLLRPKIIQNQPDLKPKDVIKMIAYEWSHCDPEKKKSFQDEYNLSMEKYMVERENYEQSITSEQKDLIENVKLNQKLAKERAHIKEVFEIIKLNTLNVLNLKKYKSHCRKKKAWVYPKNHLLHSLDSCWIKKITRITIWHK